MAALGYSLNTLTLFGLVLAIGIVVDDAIVVVENVERNIALGLTPREAAHRTMNEVGTAIIAISLVLTAVFVPTAFIPGISGQFYKQFAVTIAASTLISAFNSLTLSPALAATVLKPHDAHRSGNALVRGGRWLAGRFNAGFDRASSAYAASVGSLVKRRIIMLAIYAGLLAGTVYWPMRCRAASFRSSTRAMPSSSFNCRTALSVAHRRSGEARLQIIQDTPGVIDAVACRAFRRHSH
jgi:HAE1 family hydrophobic/amphiphilic exporter-1